MPKRVKYSHRIRNVIADLKSHNYKEPSYSSSNQSRAIFLILTRDLIMEPRLRIDDPQMA